MMARERTLTGVPSVEAGASPRAFSAADLDNDRLSAFRRLTLDSALAEILRRFDVHEVQSLLLKGAAFASWLYDDPRERPYGDIDLLIRPDQFDIAKGVLVELNFDLSEPHPSVRFSPAVRIERAAYHERWVRSGSLAVEVELHHTLGLVSSQMSHPGPSPGLVWERLTEGVRVIEVGGAHVNVPSPAVSVLIVALHAAFHEGSHWPTPGGGPPPPMRDLHQAIARVDVPTWRAAATLADELGARAAFTAGLRLGPAGRELSARLG
jgi:Uncharacterised nucleotidyltransferase